MAKLLNTRGGALGFNTMPLNDKDGKPDRRTVKYIHAPAPEIDAGGNVIAPGEFEIEDEDLARLLDKKAGDTFTKHHFASRRILRADDSAVTVDPEPPVVDKGGKGR